MLSADSPESLPVPQHVAIIMDGNGRWAKMRGQPRAVGHHAGVRSARKVIKKASEAGVKVLTLFAFSQENWQRPEEEVSLLISLFIRTLRREIKKLSMNGMRWRFIGDHQKFPEGLQKLMQETETQSAHLGGMTLVVAVGYSGQWDIAAAAQRLALAGEVITPDAIGKHLSTHDLPAVDLMIRSGGEVRISNFLLWQLAYAEMFFTDVLWPDFGPDDLQKGLAWFVRRERRFGRVLEGQTPCSDKE